MIIVDGYRDGGIETTFPSGRQIIVVSESGDVVQHEGTRKPIVDVSLWSVFRHIFRMRVSSAYELRCLATPCSQFQVSAPAGVPSLDSASANQPRNSAHLLSTSLTTHSLNGLETLESKTSRLCEH